MKKEDYRYVRDCIQTQFTRQNEGELTVYFPAVLSICADLFDLHNAKRSRKCRAVIVSCECKNFSGCEECKHRIRQFYGEHNGGYVDVLRPADELPEQLQISDRKKAKGISAGLRKKPLVLLECDFLLTHFGKWCWDQCNWPHESYVNMLAGLFFFCPKILEVAISSEIGKKAIDRNVTQAIKKCLGLYVLLDGIERSHKEEVWRYVVEAAQKISDSHVIEEIAEISLEKESAGFCTADRIECLCQVAEEGMMFIGGRVVRGDINGWNAIRVLGWRNYRYLCEHGKALYR